MKCELVLKETKNKEGRKFDNLVIITPNGTQFEVKLSFFNSKLLYKVKKEIEGK